MTSRPSEKPFLCPSSQGAVGSGKTILFGEHIVLYNQPAIALSLPDIALRVDLLPCADVNRWVDAWQLWERNVLLPTPPEQAVLLTQAWAQALVVSQGLIPPHAPKRLRGFQGVDQTQALASLGLFQPQPLHVRSDIPLGAGMGASAALSTALVRLACAVQGEIPASALEVAAAANAVDHVFHGRASGLDTAACAADGLIFFRAGQNLRLLPCARRFWLVLVDSGVKSKTSSMVASVSQRYQEHPWVRKLVDEMGHDVWAAAEYLEAGKLTEIGHLMNKFQENLEQLQVSHPLLEKLCFQLRNLGALGAKLTGAGGGGLVIGLFDFDPAVILPSLRESLFPYPMYVTLVGG